MIQLPTIEKFGNKNALSVSVPARGGNIQVWYSYTTPIAFYHHSTGLVVHENDWRTTTGKHINEISRDKKIRVSADEFLRRYGKATGQK